MRGGLQPIQGGVAPGSEGGVARLTAKGLNLFGQTMLAIPDKCVDVSIGVAEVRALPVGTGEAFSLHALGCPPTAFHLTPRSHSQRRRLST